MNGCALQTRLLDLVEERWLIFRYLQNEAKASEARVVFSFASVLIEINKAAQMITFRNPVVDESSLAERIYVKRVKLGILFI